MLASLQPYITPIFNACILFPPVAALFTLPWLIAHYRRFGGVAIMRAIVVYSFILYSMCAFLLTVLPLPSVEEVAAMPYHAIQWIPFYDSFLMFRSAGFSLARPSTLFELSLWKKLLTSGMFFQLTANVVMQIPLGFYLRYYFRRNWKQTLLIGLAISLFYELTQLSGLFFVYPQPYRYCEMDDLICNTLGAMIGYWLAPLLTRALPDRDALDEISYAKGKRLTLTRRCVAAAIDWLLFALLWNLVNLLPLENRGLLYAMSGLIGYLLWVVLYFGVLQWALKGRTLGKLLLRIAVRSDTGAPTLGQLLTRYSLIYLVTLPFVAVAVLLLTVAGLSPMLTGTRERVALIAATAVAVLAALLFALRSFQKWGDLPHAHFSRTKIVIDRGRNAEA